MVKGIKLLNRSKYSFIEYYNKEGRFENILNFMPTITGKKNRNFDDVAIALTKVLPEEIKLFGKPHTLNFKSRCDKWTKYWKKIINDNAKQHFRNKKEIIKRSEKPPPFIHLYDDLRFLELMMQKYKVPIWIKNYFANIVEDYDIKHPYQDECGERIMFLKLKKEY